MLVNRVRRADGYGDARLVRSRRASGRPEVSWPDFGLTTTPGTDDCCALIATSWRSPRSRTDPGNGDGVTGKYGSRRLGFESLRARHLRARTVLPAHRAELPIA